MNLLKEEIIFGHSVFMDFKQFKEVIERLKKVSERSHSAYLIGLDLMNYDEDYHNVVTILLKSIFEEEGCDWISWFLYEREGFNGKILPAQDADGNEICHTIESLWETVKQYRKQ